MNTLSGQEIHNPIRGSIAERARIPHSSSRYRAEARPLAGPPRFKHQVRHDEQVTFVRHFRRLSIPINRCISIPKAAIRYCIDCKSIPTISNPNRPTPSRRSRIFSIHHSIAGLKRSTSALTVPVASPSSRPRRNPKSNDHALPLWIARISIGKAKFQGEQDVPPGCTHKRKPQSEHRKISDEKERHVAARTHVMVRKRSTPSGGRP
jgi:hypothetical protein